MGKNPYFVGYALRMHAFNVVIQTINYVELVVQPAFDSTMSGFDGALFWLGRVKDHLAASLFLDQPEPEGNWAHDVEMVRAPPPAQSRPPHACAHAALRNSSLIIYLSYHHFFDCVRFIIV